MPTYLYRQYQAAMPHGAGALFLIQIFSTLSYSVLYSTLILYATNGMGMSDLLATSITGSFIALNYFLHLLGGYIGGRFLSYRSLFSLGMCLQILGCIVFSYPAVSYFYWGLAIFLSGSGLNMTCINCMMTQLFEPHDKRRESAFLWNYSGMNLGFFIGFMISGYLHLHGAYHMLFLLSAAGNFIALLLILYHWKMMRDRNTTFIDASEARKKLSRVLGFGLVIGLIFVLRGLLDKTELCNNLILCIGFAMFVFLAALCVKKYSGAERQKIVCFIILSMASIIFWALYQLAPMGLNLFIERNVNREVWGVLIAPQWVQCLNTIVIVIGGPLLGFLFSSMRERGVNINIPLQFSFSLLMIGIAYLILPVGIHFADTLGFVNFNWIIATYVLQSIGELFISPIGYAMIGELAPLHLRGLMMGMWMMLTGVAAILSGYFSKVALGDTVSLNPLVTNAAFSHTFGMLGLSAVVVALVLFVLVRPLAAMMRVEA